MYWVVKSKNNTSYHTAVKTTRCQRKGWSPSCDTALVALLLCRKKKSVRFIRQISNFETYRPRKKKKIPPAYSFFGGRAFARAHGHMALSSLFCLSRRWVTFNVDKLKVPQQCSCLPWVFKAHGATKKQNLRAVCVIAYATVERAGAPRPKRLFVTGSAVAMETNCAPPSPLQNKKKKNETFLLRLASKLFAKKRTGQSVAVASVALNIAGVLKRGRGRTAVKRSI